MKNSNLLNRLLSNSHEKQTPQRFGRYAVILILLLTLGVGNMWAERWVSSCNIQYYTHNGIEQTHDGWYNEGDGINIASNDVTLEFGTLTQFYFKKAWAKGSHNDEWGCNGNQMKYGFEGNESEYNLDWDWSKDDNPRYYEFPISQYDVISNAPNNPGQNTMRIYFNLNYNATDSRQSKWLYINFTIPGFRDLSTTSVTFDNTAVGSNNSKSITYTHYGTAPTNVADRYSITGTNADQFSITALSGTGATIQFTPTSAGTKTATLVINDVHGKQTSEITLTGKTKVLVTYSKGSASGATGSDVTDDKVYGVNLTLKDKGAFTRSGYHQTAWNTNEDGISGTSHDLNEIYSSEAAITLYPTWTANTYTIAFNANDANYVGTATGSTASVNATYDAECTLTSNGFSRAGYTFAGWTANADGTGTEYTDAQTDVSNLTSTNEGTVTLYAKWTENLSAITIITPETYQGSLSTTGVQNLGVATTLSLSATAANGHKFHEWIKTGNAVLSSTTDNPTTVSADGTYNGSGTVSARFISRFAVIGSASDESYGDANGMPGWDDYSKTIDYVATDDFERTLNLKGNTTYKFRLRDYSTDKNLGYENAGTITVNSGGECWLNEYNHDVTFTLNGTEEVTFKIIGFGGDHVNLQVNTSDGKTDYYTASFAYKTFFGDETTSTSVGGTVTAVDWKDYALTSGQKAKAGTAVTITATPSDGYAFAGWYSDAACTTEYELGEGETMTDNVIIIVGAKDESKAVYAKFAEKMTRVFLKVAYYPNGHGEITMDDASAPSSILVGVHTKIDLGVSPESGYYFVGWNQDPYEGADFSITGSFNDEDNKTPKVSGNGAGRTSGQILTATFRELDKIYFKNWDETANAGAGGQFWDSVYVGFGPNWNTNTSTCSKHYGADMYGKSDMVFAMERCFPYAPYEEYYVWYAYVPRSVTRIAGNSSVVFFDKGKMRTWEHFDNNNVTYRTDYNDLLDMFVPEHTQTGTYNCDCKYYSDGYWKEHYNLEARGEGYHLQKKNGGSWEEVGQFVATADGYHPTLKYDLRVDNVSSNITFRIISAGGSYYKAASTITSSNFTDVTLNHGGDAGFEMTPTVEGQYTFYIDQTHEKMKLSMNYPVATGDYRLKHTYQISSVDHYAYSDIIKAAKKADDTVSMYINMDAATKSLYIQKCTAISDNQPVWSTGIPVSNFNASDGNFDEGTGVYKFAIAITDASGDDVEISGSAVPSEIGLYKGHYYIKTDAADGGWANYKQNVMDKNSINFKKDKPETFDYYYCKWINDAGTNIKCVIANDYNNQLSDTLKGDAIIGLGVQTLPYAGNVRFSYNSYTNKIARAYINGSSNYHSKFLYLEGTSKINVRNVAEAGKTDTILTDKNNWTYMIDIKAQETARVRLTAKYGNNDGSGIVQSFIGDKDGDLSTSNTVEILGGSSGSSTWNSIRILYDFKTNYLLSAWVADGEETGSKALNADVLILRENQDDARQITFTEDEDVLSKVDTVYAALCLTRSWMTEDYTMTTAVDYSRRAFYWVSFPFDVKVSDIFGSIGVYGEDWILQTYNGKKRAEKGFWADSEENWEWMSRDDTLKAGHGYVVTLDLDEFYISDYSGKWINGVEAIYLYFPSISKVNNIKATTVSINLGNPAHYECKIERNSRNVKDSYWHCIGAPSFANVTRKVYGSDIVNPENPSSGGDMPATPDAWTTNLLFVYEWDYRYSYLFPEHYKKGDYTFEFKAMHSYLVQYKQEEIEWTVVAPAASIVARRERSADEIRNCNFKLQLFKGNKLHDQTFVYMSDDEAITNNFEFNYDLSKETSSSHATLWTLTADTIDVAANCLPFSNQTTIIPVGVKTTAAGDYTFTMPEGTNGIGVIIVDNITGSRTNLGLTDYTVTLAKGTIEGRFSLEISPISQVHTGIEQTGAGVQDCIHKVMIDGILYIVKDGVIYDARGNRVK